MAKTLPPIDHNSRNEMKNRSRNVDGLAAKACQIKIVHMTINQVL